MRLNQKEKRLAARVILITMVVSIIAGIIIQIKANAQGNVYNDIEGHWAKASIERISNYGLIAGYEDGRFGPDDNMTRGQMAVIIDRIMKYKDKSENEFKDLDNSYYTDAILKLNKQGIMSGYSNQIRPNDLMTREEVAVIVCRTFDIADSKDEKIESKLKDIKNISDWAKDYVINLENAGIVGGDQEGKFNGSNNITRAEVIKILDNAVGKIINEKGTVRGDSNGVVVISSGDSVYSDGEVDGDIIITSGCDSNTNVTLENLIINGELKVFSECPVIIKNTTVKEIQCKNKSSIAIGGQSNIDEIYANGDLSIEKSGEDSSDTGSTVKVLEITDDSSGAEIALGKGVIIGEINLRADKVKFNSKGNFKELNVLGDDNIISADRGGVFAGDKANNTVVNGIELKPGEASYPSSIEIN